MAIYSDNDHGSIFQIKITFVLIRILRHHQCTRVHNIENREALLNQSDEGGRPKLRFLPGAIQQLKMLPRADRKSHFWHPRANTIPHFDSPRVVK